MIVGLALGGYAVLVLVGAPRLLPRLRTADRTPRRGVALLLVLAYSLPLAMLASSLALGTMLLDELDPSDLGTDQCADELPFNNNVSPVAPLLGAFGTAIAGLLVLRIGFCLCAIFLRARLRGRAHAAMLQVCGRFDPRIGVTVLNHDQALCYCLPGRRGRIVLTSRAIAVLTPLQLRAVVAHERAHQRGRHHLVLTFSRALRRAFPGVRLIEYADGEVGRLVELIADDAAAQYYGRRTVAAALTVLGDGHVPGGALAVVEESSSVARIARLAGPDDPRPSGRRAVLSVLVVATAVILPLTLATGSLAMLVRHCPPPPAGGSQEQRQGQGQGQNQDQGQQGRGPDL
jgi:Zn-dependent protease with chaperone function